MQARAFGATGRQVPVIGQGTWNLERDDEKSAVAALRRGLDLGLTHIDTAEMYGRGAAERLIAKAIEGRRHEVFLVSKVLPENSSRAGTLRACERSLERLATDHLDLYLLHWRGAVPLEETVSAFEQLRADGKIRAWGVSNCDVEDLDELAKLAPIERVACNQVLYHLEERAIEHAVLPWCERRGVALVGYSPFGTGSFPSARGRGGRVLQEVADAHGATPRQVALAFLVRRPPLFAIPKASDPRHVEDNAGAGELRLTPEEIARIEQAFPLGRRPRSLPTI
ncbi:MAG TPA: aldo/keto reductase [Myxococcota bacterium]|nr:aldo/keto reductase [Myxococcota bacterium]